MIRLLLPCCLPLRLVCPACPLLVDCQLVPLPAFLQLPRCLLPGRVICGCCRFASLVFDCVWLLYLFIATKSETETDDGKAFHKILYLVLRQADPARQAKAGWGRPRRCTTTTSTCAEPWLAAKLNCKQQQVVMGTGNREQGTGKRELGTRNSKVKQGSVTGNRVVAYGTGRWAQLVNLWRSSLAFCITFD